jgi:hypothetical protein
MRPRQLLGSQAAEISLPVSALDTRSPSRQSRSVGLTTTPNSAELPDTSNSGASDCWSANDPIRRPTPAASAPSRNRRASTSRAWLTSRSSDGSPLASGARR